ncbi:MAG: PilN domain-containing protein [Burkholderiales bacterium]|nr:PilN domain-containing protein [Burkholderiales bacterium]
MIRINLLPHREARRKAQRRQLALLGAMVAGLAIAIAVLVHGVIAGYISAQEERNEFLKRENARLDKEIEEIKKLKDEIQALLARKQIIETLQADRSQTVLLLDQLVRQTPDGVYLKSLKQEGLKVNITGYAQSNARVATFMRNLESAPNFESAQLVETKAAEVNKRRLTEFNLNFRVKRAAPEDGQKPGGAKPAAAKQG